MQVTLLQMPMGLSARVTLCSSSTFMIFTTFQRMVDSDDCPAPVKVALLLTVSVNWCVAALAFSESERGRDASPGVSVVSGKVTNEDP